MLTAGAATAFASSPSRDTRPCRIVCAGATDKGMVREHNEDRFAIAAELGLCVVADGLGGAVAGEVAARMAVEHVCKAVAHSEAIATMATTALRHGGLSRLIAAVEFANHEIHAAAQRQPELQGMGTTIVAALAWGERVGIVHVGDSRAYRLRGEDLRQLTEDHSWVNELVRLGALDPDRAPQFQHRNVITRAVGTRPAVEVDARLIDVAPADTLLLCTDGVCGVLSLAEIAEVLTAHVDPEEAVQRLIARSNERGGPDNATAIAIRWEPADAPPRAR